MKKKLISGVLMACLALSLAAAPPLAGHGHDDCGHQHGGRVYAASEGAATLYRLAMPVYHLWGSGASPETAVWEGGARKGGAVSRSFTVEFPGPVTNVEAYPFDESLCRCLTRCCWIVSLISTSRKG